MTITKVQLPGSVRRTFCVKNTIEGSCREPCVCQKTPSLPSFVVDSAKRSIALVDAEELVVLREELDEAAGRAR